MCIAGCKETELKVPFDTVVFDPELYHRSGLTYPHVMKLSIHWTLRSGTGQAGPSGVKPEAKPQLPAAAAVHVPERDVLVDAKLKELEGKEGPEAEQEVAQLLAANAQNPERDEDKPDSENEPIDVVTNENPPSAPVGETPAPSDKAQDKQAAKKGKQTNSKKKKA